MRWLRKLWWRWTVNTQECTFCSRLSHQRIKLRLIENGVLVKRKIYSCAHHHDSARALAEHHVYD